MSEQHDEPKSEVPTYPHSSYRVYQRIRKRDYFKVLPGLRTKRKGDWIIAIAIIAAGSLMGGMTALQSYGFTHQATPVYGVCLAPAYIANGGCFETVNVRQGSVSIRNVTEPCSGPPLCYFVLGNGSRYGG